MQAILLYWFAAQLQISTLRRQQVGLFDMKFNAELNKIQSLFLKATGSSQKMTKTKVVRENDGKRRSEAKG